MVIPCGVCGKEFKDRWKVNRHMRVHTGDKPPKKQSNNTNNSNNGQYERGYLLPSHTKAQERTVVTMAASDANKTTGYEVFVQKCFSQHKFQNPDKVKDVEEFNKQCSVWWYNLSDQDRQRFEETANQINQQQQTVQPTYTLNNGILQQTATTSNNAGEQMATFSYDYNGQVIDNNGLVINYSTSTNPQVVQQTSPGGKTGRGSGGGKKASDIPDICNKKSGYYIFAQEETQKLRLQNPNLSIVEVAKELTARWNRLDPTEKMVYEFRHQDLSTTNRKAQGHATTYTKPRPVYKSHKRRRDPNAPKQPLTAFFIYSTEERPKVKEDHPTMSVTDVAKELGRRWSELDAESKQRFHARADELRQKYNIDMAEYKQLPQTAHY
jgi:hypothetical protein